MDLLPKEMNMKSGLESFKVSLGVFVDKIPDDPLLLEYIAINSNSI
jgi:hypothetical protein